VTDRRGKPLRGFPASSKTKRRIIMEQHHLVVSAFILIAIITLGPYLYFGHMSLDAGATCSDHDKQDGFITTGSGDYPAHH
jgi:hypothetical protein